MPVQEGMVIRTNTEKVRKTRKLLYELILSDHPRECLSCARNQNCELQKLGEMIGAEDDRFVGERSRSAVDDRSPSIVRDMSKCILCRRCVTVCNEIREIGVLNVSEPGFDSVIGLARSSRSTPSTAHTAAMHHSVSCQRAAGKGFYGSRLERAFRQTEKSSRSDRPAVRLSRRRIRIRTGDARNRRWRRTEGTGFDDIFDTNFAADLTIIEEGSELLERVTAALTGRQAVLPMITSCSPGWIKYGTHRRMNLTICPLASRRI